MEAFQYICFHRRFSLSAAAAVYVEPFPRALGVELLRLRSAAHAPAGGARVLRRGSFGSLLLSFECFCGSCGTLCGSHEREKCGVL